MTLRPADDDDAGRGALRDRLPTLEPPPSLEARVRASLARRRLIAGTPASERPAADVRRGLRWLRHAGLLAAGVVLGIVAQRTIAGTPTRPAGVAVSGQYVLLLYGDPPDDTGAVHVAREREYGRWAQSLTGARWVGGHELAEVVDDLRPAGTEARTPPDRLAGYFVIAAPSHERAAAVARTCPHLKYGGRVVVMTIAG